MDTQLLIQVLSKPSQVTLNYKYNISASKLPSISQSSDTHKILSAIWEQVGGIDHFETFVVLLLNRNNKIIGWHLVSTGGVTGTVADPKIIYQSALLSNACGIILAHNHPSGNVKPSETDIKLTKKIREAGKFFDIETLDHIIITSEGFYSMADEGNF